MDDKKREAESQVNILFVTSANLATNPRCVKEIELAIEMGANVHVVKFRIRNWSDQFDRDIMASLPLVKFYEIEAGREKLLQWFVASFYEKLVSIVNRYVQIKNSPLLLFGGKRSLLLHLRLKKISFKPSLVVAHNPAAFWPAVAFSKASQTLLGIDVEDYHPGEYKDVNISRSVITMMRYALSGCTYASFASPLIYRETKKQGINAPNESVINNSFRQSQFLPPSPSINHRLQLVWFSQNVDFNRGLEKLLPNLSCFSADILITLIGNIRPGFAQYLSTFSFVTVKPAMSQEHLHRELVNYHVGLAVEDAEADRNRDICLTNKIWSYFQSGLYILASDTTAQTHFLEAHPAAGKSFKLQNPESIITAIKSLLLNKHEIIEGAAGRFKRAASCAWETEQLKLRKLWESKLA